MKDLVIKDINKIIDNKYILKDINLTFEKNKVYGIIGKNGSGKSTLLKIILGQINFNSGTIKRDNISINNFEKYIEKFGYYINSDQLYKNLNGKSNIEINKMLYKSNNVLYLNYLYSNIDLIVMSKKKVKNYSLGMKQKLGILLSLINDPEIIIYDEPTNGLDVLERNKFINLIKELRLKNKTIIITSHILEEIEKISDEVIVMNDGEVISKYNKDNIDKNLINIFLGVVNE